MAMAITIHDFDMGEEAEDHIWRHRIARDQIYEVLEHRWITIPNRKGRSADRVMIGRDNGGQCIAVPIAPTDDPTIWRPITAWYCKQFEAAKLG